MRVSPAVKAVILIRTDGQEGEWLGVAALASHIGVSESCVREHCELLASAGQVEAQRLAGQIAQVRTPQAL